MSDRDSELIWEAYEESDKVFYAVYIDFGPDPGEITAVTKKSGDVNESVVNKILDDYIDAIVVDQGANDSFRRELNGMRHSTVRAPGLVCASVCEYYVWIISEEHQLYFIAERAHEDIRSLSEEEMDCLMSAWSIDE